MDSTRRKSVFILALALSLVITLLAIVLDVETRVRLGNTYWIIALIVVSPVVYLFASYSGLLH